jgi:hypothetical protein
VTDYEGELISLWLYKENKSYGIEKKYLLYTFPPRAPHTYDFNPSKKNSFGCAANRRR